MNTNYIHNDFDIPDGEITGRVFNIQRYSIYDGDGTRTVVFLKGCNFHCPWCCNPESISFKFDVMFTENTCVNCGKCVSVCPVNIHYMILDDNGNNKHMINRDIDCIGCRKCEEVCITNSLDIIGRDVTVNEVMNVIMQDIDSYYVSSGGVTLSGGEAALQRDFIYALLRECKRNGINTAIETQGSAPMETYESIYKYIDQFLYDIKQVNSNIHMKIIGMNNINIYSNLEKLSKLHNNIVIRMPLIKGFNDSFDHLDRTFKYAIKLAENNGGITRVDLLPYHSYGKNKYTRLGLNYKIDDASKFSNEELSQLEKFIYKYDFNIRLVRH